MIPAMVLAIMFLRQHMLPFSSTLKVSQYPAFPKPFLILTYSAFDLFLNACSELWLINSVFSYKPILPIC